MRHPWPRRFWINVEKSSGCWNWIGNKLTQAGYGKINHEGRRLLAHRAAWELRKGKIPPGMLVLHRCDNTMCVRISHLFLGDQGVNVRDAMRKGRLVGGVCPGERNGAAKLTQARVRSIRAGRAKGRTLRSLAEQHRVSKSAVHLIVTNQRWKT